MLCGVEALVLAILDGHHALYKVGARVAERGMLPLLQDSLGRASLNNYRLGQILDALFAANLNGVVGAITLTALEVYAIPTPWRPQDTTTMALDGADEDEPKAPGAPRPAYGHSKDGREDLKQVLLSLGVSGDGGLPLRLGVRAGNTSAKWFFSKILRSSLHSRRGGMRLALKVRPLTTAEADALKKLAASRTAPQRRVQRAQLLWARAQGETAPAIAPQVRLSALRVRAWLRRFHRDGLRGVADAPRGGRPRRHDETARGTVFALARTTPRRLGLPFALWTLARLPQALDARLGLRVTPATIWKWRQAEGVVWKRQPSWCQATVEAAFVENRGPSSRPTRRRAQSGGASASRSWAR